MDTPKKKIIEMKLWCQVRTIVWAGAHDGGSCMTDDEWWRDKYIQEFNKSYSGIAMMAAPYTPHPQ